MAKTKQSIELTSKLPLLNNVYDPWINSTYIENSVDYQCIYKRAKFKNSLDLLYHNLKVRPDPLLASSGISEVPTKTLNPFEFDLGTSNGHP